MTAGRITRQLVIDVIRAQVLNQLNQLKKGRDRTCLFISYDLSVVCYISDRIAVIHKGKLVELCESEELFRRPLHPYTRSLLSAVPKPDPRKDRRSKPFVYDPSMHDYATDKPEWTEAFPDHFVLANRAELPQYIKV